MFLEEVVVDTEVVKNFVATQEWESLIEYLSDTFKIRRMPDGVTIGIWLNERSIDCLLGVFMEVEKNPGPHKTPVQIEILRSLRNSMSKKVSQDYISENDKFLHILNHVIVYRLQEAGTDHTLLKVLLQFLSNFTIRNRENARVITNLFLGRITQCIASKKCVYEASAVLYNTYKNTKYFKVDFKICNLILSIFDTDQTNEYIHFLMQLLMERRDFWSLYDMFVFKEIVVILEEICDRLPTPINDYDLQLPKLAFDIFARGFVGTALLCIQFNHDKMDTLGARITSLYLKVLASYSGKEQYLKYFQKNKELLIISGTLLTNIHKLTKGSEKYSASARTYRVKEGENVMADFPIFGVKAELVRLIGNMSWRDKENQDLVRTADLIPLLLDCCSVDQHNPFIMQWVILAVRNLCENNVENQKVIASLQQEGAVTSKELEELGFTVHSDGENNIKLVALDALRNRRNEQ